MEQYIWKQVGSVTERSLFLGNKKRIGSAGACWESERSLLKKQKQNKYNVAILHGTNRRTKGSGNHAIPYFMGFTTAVICQNQSERLLFHGTKNEWNVIATLHKPEGGP